VADWRRFRHGNRLDRWISRDHHRRKAGQLAHPKLLPPRVKRTTADPVKPTHHRWRRSRCHALRQNAELILNAPSTMPLRPRQNLASDLPSPQRSAPEAVFIYIHLITAKAGRTESELDHRQQDGHGLTVTRKPGSPQKGTKVRHPLLT